eukprot:gene34543-44648_t
MASTSSLQSLKYNRGSLEVLDQLLLPHSIQYIALNDSNDAWAVIRSMQVRGAPLIAITAALGLAVEAFKLYISDEDGCAAEKDASKFLLEKLEFLRTSRPTAVNLFVATDQLAKLVQQITAEVQGEGEAGQKKLVLRFIEAAEKMLEDDISTNRAIGRHGAQRIIDLTSLQKVTVLTICNTGSLATAGYGVVRSLHEIGALNHIYACETRPYNQGARLTAVEIVQDNLPGTLIADSMASALIALKGVDVVVIGADRIAANGDTANKIGSYQLAISARYHGIPFFSIAPVGMAAWNPSFDVTPSSLITGVITELGVVEFDPELGYIPLAKFLLQKADVAGAELLSRLQTGAEPAPAPTDSGGVGASRAFYKLDISKIRGYLRSNRKLSDIIGLLPSTPDEEIKVAEVGDGNLNFVYIIEGPTEKKLVIKQALPYVRCVGESWPLTLERAAFEHAALVEQQITTWAKDLGIFLGKSLFGSSAIALAGAVLRSRVEKWSRNTAMCALTEKVIFTDPYTVCELNRWTTPQLDSYAAGIRCPIGFDVGAVLSNLYLSFFSTLSDGTSGREYSLWLLQQVEIVWRTFQETFVAQWNSSGSVGDLYPSSIFNSPELVASAQQSFIRTVWRDSLGFAGAKMIRRIVGIAHVEDLESIKDADVRSSCEKASLLFARRLVVGSYQDSLTAEGLDSPEGVGILAKHLYDLPPPESWL